MRWASPASNDSKVDPKVSQRTNSRVSTCSNSSSRRPSSSLKTEPSREKGFSPFHSTGLWLAVISIPAAAFRCRTRNPQVGVATMPASITWQPTDSSPTCTASMSIWPVERPSRPTTTVPRSARMPSACENLTTKFGSSPSPTIPLKPEMLRIRSGTISLFFAGAGELPARADPSDRGRKECPRSARPHGFFPRRGRSRACTTRPPNRDRGWR